MYVYDINMRNINKSAFVNTMLQITLLGNMYTNLMRFVLILKIYHIQGLKPSRTKTINYNLITVQLCYKIFYKNLHTLMIKIHIRDSFRTFRLIHDI